MTLSTNVAITGPVSARAVYDFLRPLVGTPEYAQPDIKDGEIWNPGGIGANAWLIIHHGPEDGAKVMPRAEGADNEPDLDERRYLSESPQHNGTTHVLVDFDTAYGYRENGETCSDLHARLVTALGKWLEAQGVSWKWQNEYTGEWFDRYDGLAEFGDAHRATGADDWFRNLVLPAIAAELTNGGAS